MKEEYMVILIGAAAVFLGIAWMIWSDKRRQYQSFLRKVKRMWGNLPNREYTAKELESISHYAKNHADDRFLLDDITWNDLNMDRIFMRMNATVSSCGEDVLYQMLRMPEFDENVLKKRADLIEYFSMHEEERIEMQYLLQKVRKFSELSVSDYMYALKDVDRRNSRKYKVMAALTLVSIGLIFVNPLIGVVALMVMLAGNGTVHLRDAKEINPYLNCMVCIIRLLTAADGFSKMNNPIIGDYLECIEKGRRKMKNFRWGAYLVASTNSFQDGLEAILIGYLKICFHVDFIKFYSMVRLVEGCEEDLDAMFHAMGELDALIAAASFRETLTYSCSPKFLDDSSGVECSIENMYHPLIEDAVSNSICIRRGVLVTGSNASGKSTFLKTVAVNAILAQSIYTCAATSYCGNRFRVLTSMALRDNLESGESYYIVEIKSLQRILAQCEQSVPVLCVVDEVLRGTNTIERIAASSQILRSLAKTQVLPLAATHDVELSYILEDVYDNYHFEEEIVENDVLFSYLLKEGRATSRNAIKLLEIIGYDKKIIQDAQMAAQTFETTGRWM